MIDMLFNTTGKHYIVEECMIRETGETKGLFPFFKEKKCNWKIAGYMWL